LPISHRTKPLRSFFFVLSFSHCCLLFVLVLKSGEPHAKVDIQTGSFGLFLPFPPGLGAMRENAVFMRVFAYFAGLFTAFHCFFGFLLSC
jgi:hypothetical protein